VNIGFERRLAEEGYGKTPLLFVKSLPAKLGLQECLRQ